MNDFKDNKKNGGSEPDDLDRKLLITDLMPRIKVLSIGALLITLFLFFILPISGVNKGSWNSGPISNNHKMIENDCSACHAGIFQGIPDEKCLSCHNLSDHSEILPKLVSANSSLEQSCADCHNEHNGNFHLTNQDSALCISCHGDIFDTNPETKLQNVKSFKHHPQFKVSLRQQPESTLFTRVSLDERELLQDPTPIKLNHKIHLEADLRGVDGPVTLGCNDCHRLSADRKSIEPISFERDCQSCHSLAFDERLPGAEVPHGPADIVYSYLFTEYARAALQGFENPAKDEDDDLSIRRKPGFTVHKEPEKAVNFAKTSIVNEARGAEEQLFTKTACQLCHISTELEDVERSATISRYKVVPPQIPTGWMPSSVFNHGSHEAINCESCHNINGTPVSESTKTTDLNLPKVQECQSCHGDDGKDGMVQSDCIMCHSYHHSMSLEPQKKRHIEDIVISLNRRD